MVCFFDKNSPDFLKEKIESWQLSCSILRPQFSDNYSAFIDYQMSDAIKKYTTDDVKFIITTRIDNDDAFHKEAIADIQNQFLPEDNTIIDFEKGFCYNPLTGEITKHRFKSNQFVSYIEKNGERLKTVYCEGHPAWIGKAKFVSNIKKRLWLQVVHDRNVVNSLKGKICLNSSVLDDFKLKSNNRISFITALIKRVLQEYYLFKHSVKMILKPEKN